MAELKNSLEQAYANLGLAMPVAQGQVQQEVDQQTQEPLNDSGTLGNLGMRLAGYATQGLAGALDINQGSINQFLHGDLYDYDAMSKAYAAEQDGTATPEQLALLDSQPTKKETNRLTGQQFDMPVGLSYRDMYQSMLQANTNPDDSFIETETKKGLEKLFNLKEGSLKDNTWSQIQQKTIEPLINRSSEKELLESDDIVKGSIKFADGIKKLTDDSNYVDGGVEVADSILDLVKGVSKFGIENPIEAVEMVAGEIMPAMFAATAGGVAGLAAKGIVAGRNIGAGHDAYRENLQKFIEKNDRAPTTEELRDMQVKAAAIVTMETIADKALGKLGEGQAKTLSGLAGQITSSGLKEGATETAQSVLQATMDQEGLTKEELQQAYGEGAVGALIGAGGRVSGKPIAAATAIGTEVTKQAAKAVPPVTKAVVKGAVKAAPVVAKGAAKVVKALDQVPLQAGKAAVSAIKATPAVIKGLGKAVNYVDKTILQPSKIVSDVTGAVAEGYKATTDKATSSVKDWVNKFKPTPDAAPADIKVDPIKTTPDVETPRQEAPAASASEAQRTFYSFRQNQESMTPEQMVELADADNDLTEAQNNELRAAAQLSEVGKSMDAVSQEIEIGGGNKLSIKEHTAGIKQAIRNGNLEGAKQLTAQLQSWATYQAGKANTYAKSLNKDSLNADDLALLGKNAQGKTRSINSKSLVSKVANEAAVMQQQVDAIAAYINAVEATDNESKATTAPKEESAVEAQPEALETKQDKVEPEQEAKEQPRQAELGSAVNYKGKPAFVTGFTPKGQVRIQTGNKEIKVNQDEIEVSPHKLNVIDYKGKQYLVTGKGSIMSTASGKIVFKEDNKTRREILAIASGKVPDVIKESVAEVKPEQIVKLEETNEVAEQIDEDSDSEVVTKKPNLPEFSLAAKLLSATGYNPDLPLKQQNLIKHWFKAGKNNSALETVDNFMEALKQSPEVVEAFISDMDDAQKQSFRNFYKFHETMLPKLDAVWQPTQADKYGNKFDYRDYTQFMTEDGQLDPNVKTAIILGAYEYLVDNTISSQWKSPDDVKRMLGMYDNELLPNHVYQAFMNAGDVSTSVSDSMGGSAVSALNLKPTANAGSNAKAMLNSSLAAWSRKLLEDNDLIINTTIQPMEGMDGKLLVKEPMAMTKVNADKATQLIAGAKVAPYVTNDVFGTTKTRALPSFKPSKSPTKFKGTNQKVPKKMQEAITKHNKRPQVVNKAMDSLVSQLSDFTIYDMLGYEFDLDSVVKGKRDSVEAVNRSIENSLQNWKDFREYQDANGGIDTEFFYNHTPWSNNRLGLDSRMNPQSDKFHRFMVGAKGWDVTVDPKDKKAMSNFMLAVAEGMDIEAAKDTIEDVETQIKAKVQTPIIQAGVQEIINQMNGKEFNQDAIIAAVKATKMKAHGLGALVAYAQYRNAKGKPFIHSLMREGDGITNGVAWGSLQFPDANRSEMLAKMERFGMYSNGTTKGFANWKKETKSDDAYQNLARTWEGAMSNMVFENQKQEGFFNAMTNFIGSFMDMEGKITKEGRNAAKPILMTFVYGAGIEGILGGYTQFAVDKMYKDIATLIEKPTDADALKNVQAASEVLRQVTGKGINMNDLINFELSVKDQMKLQNNITKLYKDTLEDALKTAYPELTKQREVITEAVGKVYKVFEYEYNKAYQEFLANRPEEFKGVTDITREEQMQILTKVKNVMPILGTYFSEGNLDSGLELFKSESKTATGKDAAPYTAQIKPKKGKSVKVVGKRVSYVAPGVRTMPMTVQSLDASAMYKAIAYNVLNVFDAVGSTQNNFDESLHHINNAFTGISADYSIPSEVAKMVERVLTNASPEAVKVAFAKPKDNDQFYNPDQMIQQLQQQAKVYDSRKKKLIDGFTYSGQYFAGEDTGVVLKEAPKVQDVAVEEATNAPKTEAELRTLGSSQREVGDSAFDPAIDITAASTEATFERLMENDNTNTSQEHKAHLANVLNSLVNKVMRPLKLHIAKDLNASESYGEITGENVYIVTGTAVPQANVNNEMSAGEVFVHELVHAVTTGSVIDPVVRSELNSLWKYAKRTVTPFDLMADPTLGKDSQEYKIAEARWKHMFEPTLVDGQSNHLAEFVALGLTNAQVMSALGKIPTTKATGATGFMGKLRQAFENALKAVRSMMVGTYGKNAKDKIQVIAMQMAGIENQKKSALVDAMYKVAAPLAVGLDKFNTGVQKGIAKIQTTEGYKNLSKAIDESYTAMLQSSNPVAELMTSLITEASGRTSKNGALHDLKRATQVAQQREANAIKDAYKTAMNEAFEKPLNDEAKKGITALLLKTDFVTLLPTLAKLNINWTNFILSSELQDQLINLVSSQLTDFQKVQAENLGRFMATGENALQGALLNAENIAQGDKKVAAMVDAVASAYALKYTPDDMKSNFLLATNSDNDNLDGMQFVMNMHKQFKEDAAKELFQEGGAHIIKGWIPELHDKDIEFQVSGENDATLSSLGYERVAELPKDPLDKSPVRKFMWVNNSGVKQGYVAGILNMGRKGAKGSKVDPTNIQDIGNSIHATDKASYDAGKLIIGDNKLVPEVNSKGEIVNFRYIMKDSTKNELGANTNFDDIMGAMRASIVTKTARVDSNHKIIEALAEQYKEDYQGNEGKYIEVDTTSMPKEVKQAVKANFPNGKLMVRKEHKDLLLGYKKFSLGDMFQKDPELRNVFETIVVDTAKALLGDKAALRVRQAEDLLQGFIAQAKDIIVVRSGFVTIMNTFSNVMLLTSQGVSPLQAMKDIATVPSFISEFQKAEKQLRILNAQLPSLTGAKREAAQTKIAELTDTLYNSPVRELIEGGLLSESFEDLGEVDDKLDPINALGTVLKSAGLPAKGIDTVANVVNNVTFARGTKGYEVLSNAAKYSDFIARYSLYNHLRNEGMSRDEALGEAVDTFINYDLPTHKGLQYLNDIGLLMFSKYLIRVQKIILKTMHKNPAGVIGAILFQNMINMNEGIWKSLVGVTDPTSRISTPVDYMGMFGEDIGSQVISKAL